MIRGLVLSLLLAGSALAGEAPSDPMPAGFERRAHDRLMAMLGERPAPLVPFSTDGCSGGLSGAWETVATVFPEFADMHQARPPWEACCVAHDRAYHDAGGATSAEASMAGRLAADERLRLCVIATGKARAPGLVAQYGLAEASVATAYDALATAMFRAVRLGGAPCSGLSWRWGYGWPDC